MYARRLRRRIGQTPAGPGIRFLEDELGDSMRAELVSGYCRGAPQPPPIPDHWFVPELDVVPLRTIAGPSATPSEPVAEANHHNLAWSPIPHVGVITQSTSIVVFETHRTVVDAPSITTSSDPEL